MVQTEEAKVKKVAVLAAGFVAAALMVAQAAGAQVSTQSTRGNVVFVQTDALTGNQVAVYDRANDGTLSLAGIHATGGLGGAATGAVVDKLASQGSLVYDAEDSLLFAVNAGSDTFSVFAVDGDTLALLDVLPSGGQFPDSITVHGRFVYVLNSGGAGSVQGYRIDGNRLHAINESNRSLGLANTNPPAFLASPGQIGFTPDGSSLIVTTKASTSSFVVFGVRPDGRLRDPVVTTSANPVPFGFTFDPAGRVVAAEAGGSVLTTYTLNEDNTLSGAQSKPDGQAALCWVANVGSFYYVANAGSASISGYQIDGNGTPSFVTANGVVGSTEAGAIDLVGSSDGRFLYAQSGGTGNVDEFAVATDGTLTKIGVATGLNAGFEGIAAS
jgi:6-phosphogluconolactonase (cycloisomerase 2 family)